jgi:pimeloyl-ACP methyl ester carboxylesterase
MRGRVNIRAMLRPFRPKPDLTIRIVRLAGDGLELAGEAYGDSAAAPVLFFHGGGQSRSAWRGSARILGDAGYYAITFDLRGHGESEWAADGDYLLDAFGRDVERLLYQFERPVALVGASRGGQAALVGGSRHPHRVRLIMLADVAPMMQDSGIDGIRAFFACSEYGFASLHEAADALAQHLGQPRLPDPSGLRRAMRRDEYGRWHWHWDPATGKAEFLHPPSEEQAMLDAAGRTKSPLILVRAEHSHLVTDKGVATFRRLAPQLEVTVAKGARHMFTADRNDQFAADLLRQLAAHPEWLTE